MKFKTIIHVSQQAVRHNNKHPDVLEPPLLVLDHGGPQGGRRRRAVMSVQIDGPSQLVYSPFTPLSCGARCWIETESPVTVDAEVETQENPSPGLTDAPSACHVHTV